MGRASVLSFVLGCLGGVAQAAPPPEVVSEVDPIDIPPDRDPLAHAFLRYDTRGGFYLRPSVTLGYQSTRLGPAPWEGETERVRASGFATAFGIDVGGYLRPWVALHLDASASQLWNGSLDREWAVETFPTGRILAYGAAPAATFVLPQMFFIKTAFGVGIAEIKRGGRSDWTKPGFYMDLALGKDLWWNDHLAFGIEMQILYMRLNNETRANEARLQQYTWGFSLAYDSI